MRGIFSCFRLFVVRDQKGEFKWWGVLKERKEGTEKVKNLKGVEGKVGGVNTRVQGYKGTSPRSRRIYPSMPLPMTLPRRVRRVRQARVLEYDSLIISYRLLTLASLHLLRLCKIMTFLSSFSAVQSYRVPESSPALEDVLNDEFSLWCHQLII